MRHWSSSSSKLFWSVSPRKTVCGFVPLLCYTFWNQRDHDMNLLKSLEPAATVSPHRLFSKFGTNPSNFASLNSHGKQPSLLCPFCRGPRLHLPFGQTRGFAFSKSRGEANRICPSWEFTRVISFERTSLTQCSLKNTAKILCYHQLPSRSPDTLAQLWHTFLRGLALKKNMCRVNSVTKIFKTDTVGSSLSSVNATRPGRVSAGMAASSVSPEEFVQCFKYAILLKTF